MELSEEQENEYVISKILKCKETAEGRTYLVSWKGYEGQDTWEPEGGIKHTLAFREYWEKNGKSHVKGSIESKSSKSTSSKSKVEKRKQSSSSGNQSKKRKLNSDEESSKEQEDGDEEYHSADTSDYELGHSFNNSNLYEELEDSEEEIAFTEKKKEVNLDGKNEESENIDIIFGQLATQSSEDSQSLISPIYLVKFRARSYLHVEKLIEEEFYNYPNGKLKLKLFLERNEEIPIFQENEIPFNPDFILVDRILEIKDDKVLVKWRTLPYDQSTWETRMDMLKVSNYQEQLKFYKFINSEEFKRSKVYFPPRPVLNSISSKDFIVPTFKNDLQLKKFQESGFQWLIDCYYNKRNSILADEMGLGKTIQAISVLQYLLFQHHISGPFLVVVPLSVLHNWKLEIELWTDFNCVVLHGNYAARQLIHKYELKYSDEKKDILKFDIIITTYEMVGNEPFLFNINWRCLIVDEAHKLKNSQSQTFRMLSELSAEHKILLTGTPFQNEIKETWSLLNFIHPQIFDNCNKFVQKYGNLHSNKDVEALQNTLKPYILRRMKSDVDIFVPPKEEILIELELTIIQKSYYRALFEKSSSFLIKGTDKFHFINLMMNLRKVCNHPFLIPGAQSFIESNYDLQEPIVQCSSKFVFMDKLLSKLRENKSRVLIFSQFTSVLNLIEAYINLRQYTFVRIDGKVSSQKRQEAISRFTNPDQDIFIFLLSTRAGGLGLNLTIADTVVLFDSDWNPQGDNQAQSRCHRIGQEKRVTTYRLITKDTYERYLFEVASKKLGLELLISQDMESLSKEDIDVILRYGIHKLFTEDREKDEFDFDAILENARKITYEDNKSKFSTSFFLADKNDASIKINDKNFWAKILPEIFFDLDKLKELLDNPEKLNSQKKTFIQNLKHLITDSIPFLSDPNNSEKIKELKNILKRVLTHPSFSESELKPFREFNEKLILKKRTRSTSSSRENSKKEKNLDLKINEELMEELQKENENRKNQNQKENIMEIQRVLESKPLALHVNSANISNNHLTTPSKENSISFSPTKTNMIPSKSGDISKSVTPHHNGQANKLPKRKTSPIKTLPAPKIGPWNGNEENTDYPWNSLSKDSKQFVNQTASSNSNSSSSLPLILPLDTQKLSSKELMPIKQPYEGYRPLKKEETKTRIVNEKKNSNEKITSRTSSKKQGTALINTTSIEEEISEIDASIDELKGKMEQIMEQIEFLRKKRRHLLKKSKEKSFQNFE